MKSCFIEKNSSNVKFTMPVAHSHAYYELYILANGERTIYIENEDYALEQHDLLLIPSGILHRTTGETYTRYLVNFTAEYLNEYQLPIIELCERTKITMTNEEASKIISLVETMYDIQQAPGKNINELKEHNIKVCFSYLLFELSQLKSFPSKKHKPKRTFNDRTRKIITYIHEHFNEKITLDFLCEMLYVSKPALCSDFKKNTNMSIIDYLLKTRIKNAQHLLTYYNYKMSEISEMCGFSSQNYFNLIFTKHVKASPMEYKKSHKQFHINLKENKETNKPIE